MLSLLPGMKLMVTFRRLLVALITLGLILGSAAFASPMTMGAAGIVKTQSQTANMPCGMSMMPSTDGTSTGKLPCNAITPDCVKQLVCAQVSALPQRFVASKVMLAFVIVTFWSSLPLLDGLTVEPDLSPPLAA